jgi:general secretion pathway protein K
MQKSTVRLGRTRGLALVTVLWLISLLTLLATTLLAITRNHARMASRSAQIITAKTIADSAIRLTLLRIAAPLNESSELAFSAQWPLQVFDRTVDVRIEREAGRVDLNASDPALLAAVFRSGGIDSVRARDFASRILDWRDADDQPGSDGAENDEYKRANLGYGPRNAPFESIGELRQVLGLEGISPQVLDAFTVYSTHSPTISPAFAHPLVRKALGEQLASNHAAMLRQNLIEQVVRIHACTEERGVAVCRVAVVRLTPDGQRPFLIYAWYSEDRLQVDGSIMAHAM